MLGVSAESLSLIKVEDEYMNKSITDIIHEIYTTPLKVTMPQVAQMCKLYLVNPATTATAERPFSLLRCLKSYLHSTVTQARLNSLLLMTLYSHKLDEVEMNLLVNDFINSCDSKRTNTFALMI